MLAPDLDPVHPGKYSDCDRFWILSCTFLVATSGLDGYIGLLMIHAWPAHLTSSPLILYLRLIYLLVREPLARLQILLLKRRIQYTQSPYLASRRRVVALNLGLLLAVCGLKGGCAGGLE